MIKLSISISFVCLKEIKTPDGHSLTLTKNDYFVASVNLYGTLVHMENTVQIDSERHTVKISIYPRHENYSVSHGKV